MPLGREVSQKAGGGGGLVVITPGVVIPEAQPYWEATYRQGQWCFQNSLCPAQLG